MVWWTSRNWPRLKSELIFIPTFTERVRFNTCVLHPGEGEVLNKVLYREALPRGLTSYSLREDPPGLWNSKKKKRSRLVTTAATSWQRFWSKILLVHKVARDFLAIHKPHRSSFFLVFFACLFVFRSFPFACLFVCLFDFVLNCLFQEPRKRRFTNWSSVIGTFRIPRRPWDEHDCEANAGQLLCKNKTNRGNLRWVAGKR